MAPCSPSQFRPEISYVPLQSRRIVCCVAAIRILLQRAATEDAPENEG
jgi:hypothetical protein